LSSGDIRRVLCYTKSTPEVGETQERTNSLTTDDIGRRQEASSQDAPRSRDHKTGLSCSSIGLCREKSSGM
jgi:hypothetical protein